MAGIGLHRSRQAPAQETPSFGSIAERFRRAGDLDRAIALCQEGLKKFPNQLSARVTLGWSFLDKGEYDLARTELERVLRRAPDNLAAIRGLAELHDRTEHGVSGIGPDGTWSAPEEAFDEPASAVGEQASAVEIEVPAVEVSTTAEAAMPPAPAVPLPVARQPIEAAIPVPVHVTTTGALNPLSLIETPAQAAIAHSPIGEPHVPSVFEDAPERSADVVEAVPSEPEAVLPPFEEIDPVSDPLIAALEASEWDVRTALSEPVSEPETVPLLFSESGDIALDEVASELAMAAPEPAVEEVIDLPMVDGALEGVLEGALSQFEEAAAPESVGEADGLTTFIAEPAAFEADVLDLVLASPYSATTSAEVDFDDAALVETVPEPAMEVALASDRATDLAPEPVIEPTIEPTVDLAMPPTAEPIVEATVEPATVAETEPEPVDEPLAAFAETGQSTPARAVEAVEAVEAIEDEIASSVGDPLAPPEATWLPPAVVNGHATGVAPPVTAAASVHVADADADLFSFATKNAPPVRPAASAPIAALEAFLQKVSSRKLHLTPDSVA